MSRTDRHGASCSLDPADTPQKTGDVSERAQGEGARIFGKESCPHTRRARAALPRAQFVDVLADPAALAEMLRLSDGVRRIPVIVRPARPGEPAEESVAIGFQRGA